MAQRNGIEGILDLSRMENLSEAADACLSFAERLFASARISINVLDLNERLLYLSPYGRKVWALEQGEVAAGSDWAAFWSDGDVASARRAAQTARDGTAGRFRGRHAQKWWDVTVTPILSADERPELLLVVAHEVAQRREKRRAPDRPERHYQALGEILPAIVFTAMPDGRLDEISGSPSLSNRFPIASRLGNGWLDAVHPDERERVRSAWQASLESGSAYDVQFRLRTADGSYRWQLVRASPQRDLNAEIVRWVGVNVDIDAERRSDEMRDQLMRFAGVSGDFISIVDVDGKVAYLNAACRSLLEIGAEEPIVRDLQEYFIAEDQAFVAETLVPAVRREGRWLGECRLRNFRSGSGIPVSYHVVALFDEASRYTGMAIIGRDLRDYRRFEVGIRALAEIGATMYESLSLEGTERNVADAVTRNFASFCVVDSVAPDGSIRSVAASGGKDGAIPSLELANARANRNADHPVVRAVNFAESTLLSKKAGNWTIAGTMAPAVTEEIERFSVQSLIVVPIRASQESPVIGALTCYLDGEDQRGEYTSKDLRFAEEIGTRAGLALEHAKAYQRERRIAVALQEACLPKMLPSIDGMSLSAEYCPGSSEATIGGDWYDAFVLEDGHVVITVGDVQATASWRRRRWGRCARPCGPSR